MIDTSSLTMKEIKGTSDLPGLISYINKNKAWTYLSADWQFYQSIENNRVIHPGDADRFNQIFNEAFQNCKSFSIDYRIEKTDGTYSCIRENAKPVFGVDGSLEGFNCVAVDITDLHKIQYEKFKTENLLNQIMNHSTDMVALYDKEFRVLAVNQKVQEMIGFAPETAIGKTYFELFPNGEQKQGFLDLKKAMEGTEIHNEKFHSVFTNRTYENFLFPMRDEFDNVYAVLAVAHDNTEHFKTTIELENAYQILEEKNKELERSNKELGSFTYIASHDLQEPLRKIQAFGKRLVEKETENLSTPGKDYLSRMVDAAQRMQVLIDSLLEFSRTTTAIKKFEESDLNILIDEVKKEMRFSLDEKNATVDVAPMPKMSVIPFQFKQLVSNLISNSLKYSKQGVDPVIKIQSDIIASKMIDRPGILTGTNYCRISFKDNGIGFDPVFSDQIFELFQRLHGRAEYSGSGIGLSICKKIAENHQGFFTVESKPDEGATFYLHIPIKH